LAAFLAQPFDGQQEFGFARNFFWEGLGLSFFCCIASAIYFASCVDENIPLTKGGGAK
jgi:hypothetical protein